MAQTAEPLTVLAGRYVLEEELGRSRTGMVWRAHDSLLQRTVAVKLVHPRLCDDPTFTEALGEQARRVAGLSVSGIARLLDTGEQEGVTFLVREHAAGSSARARLEQAGPLSAADACRITAGVARALGEAHDQSVLHLALDADDVILAEDGRICLTDMGIGGVIAATRPNEAAAILGEERLAPEQISGAPVDARTDVHALGTLLFELITGEPPRGRTSPRAVRADVPKVLDRVAARALDPDPHRRFATARELADVLDRVLETDVYVSEAGQAAGELRWIGVPIVIVGIAAAAIALGLWLGELEVGGPLGIRPASERPLIPPITLAVVRPESVTAIDPFGDGDELSSNAPLAGDGDPDTAWKSEDYFDGELGKPGIGLLLDLGHPVPVLGLRLSTPHPGFSFRVGVGDDPGALFDRLGAELRSSSSERVPLHGTGRYVLVWITSVVPVDDGNRAEVSELRVVISTAEEEARA